MGVQVEINDSLLLEAGYVQASKFEHIDVSFNVAAKIVGVATSTLIIYANLGLIPVTEENKVRLSDALKLDFNELHKKYISCRQLTVKSKKKGRLVKNW